jgi:hypothetical protein
LPLIKALWITFARPRAKGGQGKHEGRSRKARKASQGNCASRACAGAQRFHVKSADDSLQSYRDSVVNNPEAEKRRNIARAWARTVAVGLH